MLLVMVYKQQALQKTGPLQANIQYRKHRLYERFSESISESTISVCSYICECSWVNDDNDGDKDDGNDGDDGDGGDDDIFEQCLSS